MAKRTTKKKDKKTWPPSSDKRFYNMARYYSEICGWNLKPGVTKRWFDISPGSNCVKCVRFLRQGPKGTLKHKLWLSPRGSIKSTIMATEVKRVIQLNPGITIAYFSQSEEMVLDKPRWILTRLEYEAEKFGWHPPKTSIWSPKKFIVSRPADSASFDPTLRAFSVEKPGTGIHWDIAALDDVVGDYSNRSAHMRKKTITWFEDFWAQKTNESEVWVIGTLWPHYNLYRFIMDKMHQYFDIQILGTHDSDHNMTYPWYTEEYLQEERAGMNQAKYDAQFLNKIRTEDELIFHPEQIEIRDPGRMQLNHYLLADLGTSVKEHRHSSKSAMFLVGIGYGENAWLFDGWCSKGTIMDSGERMIGMLKRAKAQGRYPLAYTVESTGPAASAWPYFDKLIEEEGLPQLPKVFLSRNTTEKHARIERIQPFVNDGRIFVMPATPEKPGFPPGMFQKDAVGTASGTLAESMNLYERNNDDESWDDLDALADIAATDKVGNWRLPRPGKPIEPPKPETDYDRAVARAMRKMKGGGKVYLK